MLGCDADSGTREGVLLMADLEGSLLPPKPESAINLRDASYRSSSASGRQPFRGVDVLGLNECGQDHRFRALEVSLEAAFTFHSQA
ncbi:hypothetical protein OIU78_019069 [Salix suchowensis]|nr:hypothetical protein OIU78_019069 [Salix suchowensis]